MKNKDLSLVQLAKKRQKAASEFYAQSRMQSDSEYRFIMGDSENLGQWDKIANAQERAKQGDVMLTINIAAQHNNVVVNNFRQGKPTGKVIPVDGGADKESAQMMEGWLRSIKSATNSDDCAVNAYKWMVDYGEGYSWLTVEYESEDSFNQVIKEYPINDPRKVLIDHTAEMPDRSDADWGFIFSEVPKEEIEKYSVDATNWEVDGFWCKDDAVTVALYYYCEYIPDVLQQYEDGSIGFKSENNGKEVAFDKDLNKRERKTNRKQWSWAKLVGNHEEPIDGDVWLGKWLPIVPMIGIEYKLDGVWYTKGLTRDAMDMYRIVNYSMSSAVEAISLQPKAPFIIGDQAVGPYQAMWDDANSGKYSALYYKEFNADGTQNNKPSREQQALPPTAQLQLLDVSINQAKAATGQQDANFGVHGQETSGLMVQERKMQGELATYHFIDKAAIAIKHRERMLVDLAPKIYNEEQVIKILGLDGSEESAKIEPGTGRKYEAIKGNSEISHLFDPKLGRYDVDVDTGASYQTLRKEGNKIATEILSRDPNIKATHGDILFNMIDAPGFEEMADRSRKMLPPELRDDQEEQQIPPEVKAQMDQVAGELEQANAALEQAAQKVKELQDQADRAEKEKMLAQIDAKEANSMLRIKAAEPKKEEEPEINVDMEDLLYKMAEQESKQDATLDGIYRLMEVVAAKIGVKENQPTEIE